MVTFNKERFQANIVIGNMDKEQITYLRKAILELIRGYDYENQTEDLQQAIYYATHLIEALETE
jgi:hypothetical protein